MANCFACCLLEVGFEGLLEPSVDQSLERLLAIGLAHG